MSEWQPIETAPKDGTTILVNDTTGTCPWAAARYSAFHEWSGWAYDDDILQDACPNGPQPTHWFDVPEAPQ